MSRIAAVFGCLVALSVLAVGGTSNPNIDQIRTQWIRNFEAKDVAALVALYSNDAVILPASGGRIVGREEITTFFKKLLDPSSNRVMRLNAEKTDWLAEIAYENGEYEETVSWPRISGAVSISGNVSFSGGGGETKHKGSYLVVLRRHEGKWLIVEQAITEVALPPAR